MEAFLDPRITSFVLGILSFFGVAYGVRLTRKGKREDTRIAETNQTFLQLQALSDGRLVEINRLNALVAELRGENDRIREAWESRWERQMKRCRHVTDGLVGALNVIREKGTAVEVVENIEEALETLEQHNTVDHADPTVP